MARTLQNHHLSRLVLLFLLAAADGLAQQPLLYYCGDPSHAYLWVDPNAQAVVVTRQNEHWTTPPDTDPAWSKIQPQLGQVKPGAPDDAIQFLCQTQPDNASAHPRYPDREIYVRKQPDGTLRISFITPSNSPTFSFVRVDKDWKKSDSTVNIPLPKLLNQPSDGDAAAVMNQGTRPDMKTFWTSWIDGALHSTQPLQHVYPDDTQKPLWLWAEAVSESRWSDRMHRPMPAQAASAVEKKVKVPVLDWVRGMLFLLLGLVIGAGVIFGLRRRPITIPASVGKPAPAQDDQLIQQIETLLKSVQANLLTRMESLARELKTDSPAKGKSPRDAQPAIAAQPDLTALVQQAYNYAQQLSKSNLASLTPTGTLEQWLQNLPQALHATDSKIVAMINQLISDRDDNNNRSAAEIVSREKQLYDLRLQLKQNEDRIRDLESAQGKQDAWLKRSAQVQNLLAPLGTAQTNYLDGFRDPPSSAMLAFLISHSLLHLSLGLLNGDDNAVRAMKANLTSICRKLSPLQIPGFQKTLEQIEKQQWNVESLTDKMVRSDDHRDAGIYQVVLKYLRDYQKLDLAPFYITVDENGLAYRAN
jgi:hypothetical protein